MTAKLLVGTRKGLFVWSRGPSGWKIETVHFLGEPVTMLLPHPHDGSLYASLTLGHFGAKLRRLRSGAEQWEECGLPTYPADAQINDGPPGPDEATRKTVPASLKEIWALEAGGVDEPGVLWAGTIPGGLFRSSDDGASWELNQPLWTRQERWRWFGGGKDDPGIHSISVDPRNSRSVSIGISCGGVWRTDDSGKSWICQGEGLRAEYMPPNLADDPVIQDPHRLVRCAAAPDTLWIQHHNGVFRSHDGGQRWTELTHARPTGFGFAVAAHPEDEKTAWFVPADDDQCRVPVESQLVVSRTRDGGESFEILSRGLPGPHAYDIVYRHAFDVDRQGRMLAMGSTTGGFWVSEDEGGDWTCLSQSLPPVYCVRFAATDRPLGN